MSDELPEGWAAVPLGELVRPSKEKAEPGTANGLPYLGMEHVEAATGRVLGHGDASEVRSTTAAYRAGDVLYGKLRPYLNKVTVAPFDGVGSTEFIVFAQQAHLDSRYLRWLLARREFVEIASERAAGVQLPRVTFDKLADLEQPLPPLAEQRRIVAKVEALLEQVRRAKDRLDRVPLILKRFRQAVLGAACSGALTEHWRSERDLVSVRESISQRLAMASRARTRRGVPEQVELPEDLAERDLPASWTWASVAELLRASFLQDVKDGNHGANHPKVAEFTDEGLPFITAAQVNDFSIDYAGAYKLAGRPLERIHVGHAKAGDAILTHKGSVGRTAVCERDCVLTPQTTYYRPDPSVIDARFLMYLFASPCFYGQLAAVMSQTTRDFVPISEQYLLFLALPTVDEQREIARRVDGLFALAAAIEQRVERAAARAGNLPQAILSKALAGELVPTEADLARAEGRDYETAQQLLQRTKTVDSNGSLPEPRIRPKRLRVNNNALRAPRAGQGRSP